MNYYDVNFKPRSENEVQNYTIIISSSASSFLEHLAAVKLFRKFKGYHCIKIRFFMIESAWENVFWYFTWKEKFMPRNYFLINGARCPIKPSYYFIQMKMDLNTYAQKDVLEEELLDAGVNILQKAGA